MPTTKADISERSRGHDVLAQEWLALYSRNQMSAAGAVTLEAPSRAHLRVARACRSGRSELGQTQLHDELEKEARAGATCCTLPP